MNIDELASQRKNHLTSFFFVAGFLLYVGFFYPGFMSTDSAVQILQARQGFFSDWHPPAMAYLWGLVESITVPGPAGMLILQSAMIWGGAFLTYRAYFRQQGGTVAAIFLCLMLFFPPIFGIAGVVWKDIFMWGLLFLAFGAAGHISPPGHRHAMQTCILTILVFMLLLAAILVRYDAAIAVIPLAALVFSRVYNFVSLRQLTISLTVGGGLAIFGLGSAIALNDQLSDRKDHAWVLLSVFDIAGVIVKLENQEDQQALYNRIPEIMRKEETVDALLHSYSARYCLTLFVYEPVALRSPPPTPIDSLGMISYSALNSTELEQLKQLWLSLIRDYPLQLLTHRMAVFNHVLGLTPDHLWSPSMMKTNGFDGKLQALYGSNPESTYLQKVAEQQIASLDRLWLFRPWFYLILALDIMAVTLLRFRLHYIEIILLNMSGYLHELALFFIAPSPDFRYSHYLIFTTILSFLLLVRPSLMRLDRKRLGLTRQQISD